MNNQDLKKEAYSLSPSNFAIKYSNDPSFYVKSADDHSNYDQGNVTFMFQECEVGYNNGSLCTLIFKDN